MIFRVFITSSSGIPKREVWTFLAMVSLVFLTAIHSGHAQTDSTLRPPLDLSPAVPGTPPSTVEEPPTREPAFANTQETGQPVTGAASDLMLSPRQVFRIGYLTPASGSVRDREWYRSLRDALLQNVAFMEAAQQVDIRDVGLRPCEGPEDMRDRMALEEFDLVFCPALVYAQQMGVEPGPYHVVFQTRRRDDHDRSTTRGPVLHRGVLFTRRASDLDGQDSADKAAFRRALHGRDVAVPGHSDTTFFYMRKKLWEDYDQCRPNWLSFGTPEDVVKAVVSGLVEAGVCSEGVLSDVFEAVPDEANAELHLSEEGNDLVGMLERTQPMPTDPVVVHSRFLSLPTEPNPVGLALYEMLLDFYSREARADAGAPVLVPGEEEAFARMASDIRQTDSYDW